MRKDVRKDIIPSEFALFIPFKCPSHAILIIEKHRLVVKVYRENWGFSESLYDFLIKQNLETFTIKEFVGDLPVIKRCVIRGIERKDLNILLRGEILCVSQIFTLGEVIYSDVDVGKVGFETVFEFLPPIIVVPTPLKFVQKTEFSFPLLIISNQNREVIEFLNSLGKKYFIYDGDCDGVIRKMKDYLVVKKVAKYSAKIKELSKEKNVILLSDSPIVGFNTVHLELPTHDDRKALIRKFTQELIQYEDIFIDLKLINVDNIVGKNFRFRKQLQQSETDFEQLDQAALEMRGLSILDIEQVIRNTKFQFNNCLLNNVIFVAKNSNPSSLADIVSKIPSKTFADFFGIDEMIRYLDSNIVQPFKNPHKFKNIITPPKGVLIHGGSGSGKTSLGIAIANETGLPTIALSAAELRTKIVGESEEKIRRLFQQARGSQPCILLIENFEMICPRRTENSGTDKRIVTTFLTEMDGILNSRGVFVIAITGNLNIIDEAVKRPGRLDIQVELNDLDEVGRKSILEGRLRNLNHNFNENYLSDLASRLQGCSNAHVASIIDSAAINAIKRGSELIEIIDIKMV